MAAGAPAAVAIPGDANAAGTPSPTSIAFALGWQMAELYAGAGFGGPVDDPGPDTLPSLVSLGQAKLTELGLAQVDAALTHLATPLADAPTGELSTQPTRSLLEGAGQHLDALRDAIKALHVRLIIGLTAADFRLGKAYRIGRSLADTALLPNDRDSFEYAFGPRVDTIKDSLADLASALPDHCARAVAISLSTWDRWAANPTLEGPQVQWDADWPKVRPVLHRQGQLWRALLSGEKQGTDMLTTDALVRASQGLIARSGALAWSMLRRFWIPVVVVFALLAAGIALLVVGESDATKVIGAISAAAGSVGVTWRGLASRVGKTAGDVESHLWGAELDVAVAVAITRGPDGWGEDPSDLANKLPAAGEEPQAAADLMVIGQFQTALEKNRLTKPRDALLVARRLTPNTQRLPDVLNANAPTAEELLHPYARFTPEAGVHEPTHIQGRTNVVAWLADPDHRAALRLQSSELVSAGGGQYVSGGDGATMDVRGQVWVIRHGVIIRWEHYEHLADARAAAGLAP